MTVFFPLNCLSEMFSPVVDGRLKSGAGLPMTGKTLVVISPPRRSCRAPESGPGDRGRRGGAPPSIELPVSGVRGERLLEILLDHAPVQVVEERLDVLGPRPAVVDPVRVLVDIERQD